MIEEVDVKQMEAMVSKGAQLVDVREDEELSSEGLIEGMTHMPLSTFEDFEANLDKTRPVVFYCRSGRRSLKAAEIAETWTSQPVYSLKGGIIAYKQEKQT